MPFFVISFKCDKCNDFSYSVSDKKQGASTKCRFCSSLLTKQCGQNENPNMIKGVEAKATNESAQKRLNELLCEKKDDSDKLYLEAISTEKKLEGTQKNKTEPKIEPKKRELKEKTPVNKAFPTPREKAYNICYCKSCDKYILTSDSSTKCSAGHPIDKIVPPKYRGLSLVDSWRKLNELNKRDDAEGTQSTEIVGQSRIIYQMTTYTQDMVERFHEVVYRDWNIEELFTKSLTGKITLNKSYLNYLAGFEESTIYKRIANNRKQIENELSSIDDDNQRFYMFLHKNCLLPKNIPLCWKSDKNIYCFNSISEFINCYTGKTAIFGLTREKMQPMINPYTMQYFFFPTNGDVYDGGEANELKFTDLIMSNTEDKSIVYKSEELGSVKTFVDSLSVYDDNMDKKLAFIQTVCGSFEDSAEKIVGEIFHRDQYELQGAMLDDLDNAYITDGDREYVPEWKDKASLIAYLNLCAYQSIAKDGQLTVFNVNFGSSCDELIEIIRNIIGSVYKSNASDKDKRRFALLRLCYFSGILKYINGVNEVIDFDQNLIGALKTLFLERTDLGSFSKIITEAYYLCLNASERAEARFLYNGKSASLRQHVNGIKSNAAALSEFWKNSEVQRFISYIITGSNGDSDVSEIDNKIKDIWSKCAGIEATLNKEVNKINQQYAKVMKGFDDTSAKASKPVASLPPPQASTGQSPKTNTTKSGGNEIIDDNNFDW